PACRRLFLLLRGLAAVAVGGPGTVRAEGYGPIKPSDGWGGVREGRSSVPPLAVVSRTLDLDFDAPLFTEARARTIVLTTATADPARLEEARERAVVIVAGKDSPGVAAAGQEPEDIRHRRTQYE